MRRVSARNSSWLVSLLAVVQEAAGQLPRRDQAKARDPPGALAGNHVRTPGVEGAARRAPERMGNGSGDRRQDNPPRTANRHGRRRARALRAVSARYRDHREHGRQPASSRRDDENQPHAQDDGPLWPVGAGRNDRAGARRADRRARDDGTGTPRRVLTQGQRPAHGHAFRDQIASPARTILLVLLAAAAVVFVIALSNVANLILARSVRREGELAVRAALGAGTGALRRTLLAESLVL